MRETAALWFYCAYTWSYIHPNVIRNDIWYTDLPSFKRIFCASLILISSSSLSLSLLLLLLCAASGAISLHHFSGVLFIIAASDAHKTLHLIQIAFIVRLSSHCRIMSAFPSKFFGCMCICRWQVATEFLELIEHQTPTYSTKFEFIHFSYCNQCHTACPPTKCQIRFWW